MATLALVAAIVGAYLTRELPVDVFPDLDRPVVTTLVEAEGYAAEEVETRITRRLETALAGAPGVADIRSVSRRGLLMLSASFDYETDPYRARQIVNERLASARRDLPDGVRVMIAPMASIMGEILYIGVFADAPEASPEVLRTYAEWTLRPRVLATPGVAAVTVMGGDLREYQIRLDDRRMAAANLDLEAVVENLNGLGENTSGGVTERNGREVALRNIGTIYDVSEIENSVAGYRGGQPGLPVRTGELGQVVIGAAQKRGDASVDGRPAVILAVQKQPGASTLALTQVIDEKISVLAQSAPPGVRTDARLFRQADFIERSLGNISAAIRDAALILTVVLFLFLWNIRTTVISILAIPTSLLAAVGILHGFGYEINTMTLGGLTIAVGELVDDAIVDVENVFRRLRENQTAATPAPTLAVIQGACIEVRSSIVIATAAVILMFSPALLLDGVEGRLFRPLALAYMTAILASLAVALTLTPALAALLLPRLNFKGERDSWLLAKLKRWQERNLKRFLPNPRPIFAGTALALFLSLPVFALTAGEFLPEFNEGSLTIQVWTDTGTGLTESVRKAGGLEAQIRALEGVERTARRTGRAEQDEHGDGVYASEIEALLDPALSGDQRAAVIEQIRAAAARDPSLAVNIAQPISHRIEHVTSGVRSEIAAFLYGPDLEILMHKAYEAGQILKARPDIADVFVETAAYADEVKISLEPGRAAAMGIPAARAARMLETALAGRRVGSVYDGVAIFDIRIRADEAVRSNPDRIRAFVLSYRPDGSPVRVSDIADVYETRGPYEIKRENGERRIAVEFNPGDADRAGAAAAAEKELREKLELPPGYRLEFGGRLADRSRALDRILLLSAAALSLIAFLLYRHYRSISLTLQTLLNLPLAFIGGAFALWVANIPISIASLIGFVAVAGIAARNGILMITHFERLLHEEGRPFNADTVIAGALDRLAPALMTAGSALLGLLPILLSGPDAPGKELLFPVAAVISGGLFSSTLLDLVLTPTLYYWLNVRRAGGAA